MPKFLRRSSTKASFKTKTCAAIIILSLLAAPLLTSCGGGAGTASETLPPPETARLETYNDGTEAAQYVRIRLGFGEAVDIPKNYAPEIKIAGETVDKKRISAEASGSELTVTVSAEKIRNGDLLMEIGGKTIDALIPSGVALEARGDGAAEVTHTFNIRGIAWILLSDGGETVEGSLLAGADTLNGAVALHGHEFLADDEYDIAANLAETLTNHFGDRYTFKAEGKTVTAARMNGTSANLSITIYTYTVIV